MEVPIKDLGKMEFPMVMGGILKETGKLMKVSGKILRLKEMENIF